MRRKKEKRRRRSDEVVRMIECGRSLGIMMKDKRTMKETDRRGTVNWADRRLHKVGSVVRK